MQKNIRNFLITSGGSPLLHGAEPFIGDIYGVGGGEFVFDPVCARGRGGNRGY
jgi:hypothetical protein